MTLYTCFVISIVVLLPISERKYRENIDLELLIWIMRIECYIDNTLHVLSHSILIMIGLSMCAFTNVRRVCCGIKRKRVNCLLSVSYVSANQSNRSYVNIQSADLIDI